VPSKEPEYNSLPSGEKARLLIAPLCPCKALSWLPFFASQTIIVLSSAPDAISVPSGEKAKAVIGFVCPSSTAVFSPLVTSHKIMTPFGFTSNGLELGLSGLAGSSHVEASVVPLGENSPKAPVPLKKPKKPSDGSSSLYLLTRPEELPCQIKLRGLIHRAKKLNFSCKGH